MFTKETKRLAQCASLSLAAVFTAIGAPVSTVHITMPISPAADSTKVLVAAPYCSPVKITDITKGAPGTVLSNIPPTTFNSGCAEVAVAISPGLPGYPAGFVYVAYDDNNGSPVVASIDPTKPRPVTPTPIVTIQEPGVQHVGLVFDVAGTYGGGLLAVTQGGKVFSVTKRTTQQIDIQGGMHLESPAIAPKGFGRFGGLLWVVNELESGGFDNAIYAIATNFSATKVLDVPNKFNHPQNVAESLAFVSGNACVAKDQGKEGEDSQGKDGESQAKDGEESKDGEDGEKDEDGGSGNPGASGGRLFDAQYGLSQVALYQANGPAAYFNDEYDGHIWVITAKADGSYTTPAIFDSNLGQQEHLASAVCLPPHSEGHMTGGGSVEDDDKRVTHGMELHCDINHEPNSLEINWDKGNNFHLEKLTSVSCFLDPKVGSPHPPDADFNTIVGTGTGSCNNKPGATISFTMTDAGEPGKNDSATFKIDGGGCPSVSVSGNLHNGNQQAHDH